MTFDEAKNLTYGQILYHTYFCNADGTPQRWRVNGRVRLWKRNPARIRVPLKHGLWSYDYLDESTLHLLCLTADEALKEMHNE